MVDLLEFVRVLRLSLWPWISLVKKSRVFLGFEEILFERLFLSSFQFQEQSSTVGKRFIRGNPDKREREIYRSLCSWVWEREREKEFILSPSLYIPWGPAQADSQCSLSLRMKGAGSANQLAEPGKGILLSVEIQNCGKELNHLKFQMKLGFMNLAWADTPGKEGLTSI